MRTPAPNLLEHDMSNMSVSRVRMLPQATRLWTGDNLSRKLLLRVLSNIRIGSFTIRDGGETFRLGRAGVPGETFRRTTTWVTTSSRSGWTRR